MKENPGNWNIDDATTLYKLKDWAADYFDISAKGEIEIVAPGYDKPVRISLMDIVSGMKERGLHMPVMLRIKNILDHRVSLLNETFARAIAASGYQNHYRGVFPIKVNQQCQVVEEIAQYGARYHHGLEAGSKAELIIALANHSNNDSYIICNGYKDQKFIDLGLHARSMGIKCFFVIETPAELHIVIRRSKALGISPLIGVRAKLASEVDGHWSEDSGDRSLFGLSATQMIEVVDALKDADMLDSLQLLHFHMGSQIPNIRNIRAGMAEAIRYYVDLAREGAPMGHLDIGGGLAVDYEGAHNSDVHSKNYSLDEYCTDVVEAVMETLDPLKLPHPVILSESGRATVAYSSILMFNILDVTDFEPGLVPEKMPEDCPEQVQRLFETNEHLTITNVQRCYNNAAHYRDEVREQFRRGELDLRERALGENIYLNIVQRITGLMPQMERVPQDLESLQEDLADIYYGNFSVFQSLPDTWAIEQIFPVLPIHRLDEQPTRHAIIADLTCDCDGKIDNFIGGEKTIPLHSLKNGEDYYVGVFLVGAYQETLGDLHNLFGDTNIISIHINEDGSFDFIREMHGDSIADVLSYVEYSPERILEQFRNNAEQAVRRGVITASTRQKIMEAYSASLRGYTYYESQE